MNKQKYFSHNPLLYEVQEQIRPDEMKMLKELHNRLTELKELYPVNVTALDVNCGTGLSTRVLSSNKWITNIYGIDICMEYLRFNKNLDQRPQLIQGDTRKQNFKNECIDIAVLSSAYHHIEDEFKHRFLANLHDNLKNDGTAIILENILPFYEHEKGRIQAIEKFYSHVIESAVDEHQDSYPLDFIRDIIGIIIEYEKNKIFEYKTHYNKLVQDFEQSGFHFTKISKVWPEDSSLGEKAGNFILTVRKK